MTSVFRLTREQYIHVLDNNENISRCVVGPTTFTLKDHEKVTTSVLKFVSLPPQTYCRIKNPVTRAGGKIVQTDFNEAAIRFGHEEVRVNDGTAWTEPFPLYPGEVLVGSEGKSDQSIKKLTVVMKNTALRLRADDDCHANGADRSAGDEWLFKGPATYIPNEKVSFVTKVTAKLVKPLESLRIKARVNFTDRKGAVRTAGEEWLVTDEGAYLPDVEEEIVGVVEARVLTNKKSVEVESLYDHKDVFGKERKAGERWLVTVDDTPAFTPMVSEKVLRTVGITTLTNRQYCVVLDPITNGVQMFGHKEIRRGSEEGTSFYLHPGERLEGDGVQDIEVLTADDAYLLKALEAFVDDKGVARKAGETWMIRGPLEYIPPTEVEILDTRQALPLDENEGIYVRNEKTGKVTMVKGQTHMLQPEEVLWEKDLPEIVDELLQYPKGTKNRVKDKELKLSNDRDKTVAVRFNVPHNAAVQIYDYAGKEPRIVFGPDLVMLQPDESFMVLSLSGDKPKRPNVIKSLQLQLGPAFMTDIVTVETSDHARLELRLSYNWRFDVENKADAKKLFSVPDFVGDACKAMAGRIRGQIAMESFDSFHKNSARIIRGAVFGMNGTKVKESFKFEANNLLITNVDIQSVEPIDQKTRDSLQKSVQLAFEITTKSQEATARHKAEKDSQKATAELDRRKLTDAIEAERQKKDYLKLQAESEAVEAMGQAKAEAEARAEALLIEAESELKQAELKAQAQRISCQSELKVMKEKNKAQVDHQQQVNNMEVDKAKKISEIESEKFTQIMGAIGSDTVLAMARAGPELQAKLLEGLGLKGYLITDGNSPINLFNTAGGMVGQAGGVQMQ
eukprot:Rhum_TRINITY_DN4287_c0_g1::Rhum_TRINITY_DN4287_c0_g1_i1::g.13757::m.13757/K17266/MVP; major vault protein